MSKMQIKANELVNTKAGFVSLVKRGANRIPFRITKEDDTMLDLQKVAKTIFHKSVAPAVPEIVAAIVPPDSNEADVTALFKSAGLNASDFYKREHEGVVTVETADFAKAEDVGMIQLSNGLTLAISNMKKGLDCYGTNATSFSDVLSTEGVYPSMYTAKEALSTTISNILYKALTPSEAASQVGAAVDGFKEYVVGLLGAVPVSAFKMEAELQKAEDAKKDKKAKGGMKNPNDPDAAKEAEAGTAKKDEVPAVSDEPPVETQVAKEGEEPALEAQVEQAPTGEGAQVEASADAVIEPAVEAPVETQKGEDEPKSDVQASAETSGEAPAPVAKADDQVLAAIAALQKSLEATVEEVRSSVSALSQRVDGVAETARKADEAVNGTVFNTASGDLPTRSTKSDASGPPPLLDTAYDRRAVA